MVLIAALMMHPGTAVTIKASLPIIRRFFSCVKLDARQKLCRRILGQVVKQALKSDARFKTKSHDFVSMLGNRDKMP